MKNSLLALLVLFMFACSPTVKVEAPDKPIVINLNIKISHEVRVRIDKDLEELMTKDEDLFAQ